MAANRSIPAAGRGFHGGPGRADGRVTPRPGPPGECQRVSAPGIPFFSFLKYLFICVFIWVSWLLVAALGLFQFIAACRIY